VQSKRRKLSVEKDLAGEDLPTRSASPHRGESDPQKISKAFLGEKGGFCGGKIPTQQNKGESLLKEMISPWQGGGRWLSVVEKKLVEEKVSPGNGLRRTACHRGKGYY